jgi:hypothetical protein
LKVPENLLGKTVRCPSCKTTFVAQAREEDAIAMIDDEPRGPAPGPGVSGAQTAPRRRAQASNAAASAVKGPAISLLVTGVLAILCGFLGGVYFLALPSALQQMNPQLQQMNPQLGAPPPASVFVGYAIGSIVGGLIWGSLVIAGAICMLRLRLYAMGMTGAIVGMVPCSSCCVLGLPMGIWALVVLNRPEVKDAFT